MVRPGGERLRMLDTCSWGRGQGSLGCDHGVGAWSGLRDRLKRRDRAVGDCGQRLRDGVRGPEGSQALRGEVKNEEGDSGSGIRPPGGRVTVQGFYSAGQVPWGGLELRRLRSGYRR